MEGQTWKNKQVGSSRIPLPTPSFVMTLLSRAQVKKYITTKNQNKDIIYGGCERFSMKIFSLFKALKHSTIDISIASNSRILLVCVKRPRASR